MNVRLQSGIGILSITLLFLTNSIAQQLAFPTAEGSGRFATGGRGGTVYEVTNLNNSGPGSIVDAVSQPNRTVVFRLSGTIELGSQLLQPVSNVTIAGQTVPGDGICIKGRILIGNVSNVIIRYIRVRVDAGAPNAEGDAIDIMGGPDCKNIIIDHASVSYARDEGISCRETNTDVTVQWCIISEALTLGGNHSYGSLIRGDYGDKKTYHHNLYAHNLGRNPRPGNYTSSTLDPEGLYLDFRNNVVYNWEENKVGYNEDVGTMSSYNFIGNAYIRGPESVAEPKAPQVFREGCAICKGYFENNSYDGVVPSDPWSLVAFPKLNETDIAAYKARSAPLPMPPVKTTSPAQAKIDVLASAGASIPKRDTIDRRVINDAINLTGHFIDSIDDQPEGAWPQLNSLPAPADGDHDGMPDEWETKNGLNPADAKDGNIVNKNGYTMLEVYLNTLTGEESSVGISSEMLLDKKDYHLSFTPSNAVYSEVLIKYQIPQREYVSVSLFNILGKEVTRLVNENKQAGVYKTRLSIRNLSSGIYFISFKAGSIVQTVKFTVGSVQ